MNTGDIPSESMAEFVRALIVDGNYDEDSDTYGLPEGFVFCGAGAYRTCILAPDGYVYKVQHSTDDNWQENQREWDTYHLFGAEVVALSNGLIRLAKAVEFFTDSNVLVMEYAPMAGNAIWYDIDENDNWNEYYCSPEFKNAFRAIGRECMIDDLHGYNIYFTTNAEIVIVDYASA